MLHHKKGRTLGRKKGQRTALLRSLARSLVLQEGIVTTVAKAKELRPFVERLVTAGKKNSVASHRLVATRLGGAPDAVKKLHGDLRDRYAKRSGGYTRIILLGKVGKQATESARIEFVK
ncbi:MAG TPA: 50S ribosomal protein L17 [Candidatus Paceibacterota bacterium]|nr:50S ribosomal protein L17 [Candidatus Paceibacterota bacterium]